MDPITQGIVGGLWAQAAAQRPRTRQAAVVGGLAGMAPDLDALIRSGEDTLLHVEYHRHFTHALAFIPLGALSVALVLWPLLRHRAPFGLLYLWCLLGYTSHGLLDACTSYGVYLFWPFSGQRVSWNWISVIDPLFTAPLLILIGVAVWRKSRAAAMLGLAWMVSYMALAALQHHRTEHVLHDWARQEDIVIERSVTKPSFANLILWRGLVDDGEHFHLLAIRNLPGTEIRFWPAGAVDPFDPTRFDADARLGRDLRRFNHFSSEWLFRYRPYDREDEWFIGDLRYAIDPASQRPLWGIRFNADKPADRATYATPRRVTNDEREQYLARLLGRDTE